MWWYDTNTVGFSSPNYGELLALNAVSLPLICILSSRLLPSATWWLQLFSLSSSLLRHHAMKSPIRCKVTSSATLKPLHVSRLWVFKPFATLLGVANKKRMSCIFFFFEKDTHTHTKIYVLALLMHLKTEYQHIYAFILPGVWVCVLRFGLVFMPIHGQPDIFLSKIIC